MDGISLPFPYPRYSFELHGGGGSQLMGKVRILENELKCLFSGGGDDARCFRHGKGGTFLYVMLKTSCKLLLTWQREDTPPCHAKHLCKVFSMWQRRNTPPYYKGAPGSKKSTQGRFFS